MSDPEPPEPGPSIATPAGSLSFAFLASDPMGLAEQVRGADIALRTDDAAVVASCLTSIDGRAAEVHLLPEGRSWEGTPIELELGPDGKGGRGRLWIRSGAGHEGSTQWIVYTSGTTGEPKPVGHTLGSLTRTIVRGRRRGTFVWGLVYDPNRMAGLQVLLQSLHTRSSLVAPALATPLPERVRMMVAANVTALSATPTLWRRILQVPTVRTWSLEQITLGGEIADQQILDALRRRFPTARVTHVFASTETGAAFSVSDGLAGFPASYLDAPPNGIRLAIRDNVLFVENRDATTSGDDGFASTGDVVELSQDRVLFKGRASGVVNVGGSNVWPEQVEALLRQHPEVEDAAVSAKASSLAGNVLIASVVPTPGSDPTSLRRSLRRWVRERAPTSHVPAQVTVVDALQHSSTGKLQR